MAGVIAADDAETLHELRIAVRRTRSLLTEGEDLLDEADRQRFLDEFGWLSSVTGPMRDSDVQSVELPSLIEALPVTHSADLTPLLELLGERRRDRRDRLVVELRSPRSQSLLREWRRYLRDDSRWERNDDRLDHVVAQRVAASHRKVVRAGRKISKRSTAEELHDLRKDAKRLRYLMEDFAAVIPNKPMKSVMGPLRDLLDTLGNHHDAVIQSADLELLAVELAGRQVDPRTLLAIGGLVNVLEGRSRSSRRAIASRFADCDSRSIRRCVKRIVKENEK